MEDLNNQNNNENLGNLGNNDGQGQAEASNNNYSNQANGINNDGGQTPNYNNYAANANNSAKKKSKAPIIIVVILIVVLLLGCIVSAIIFAAVNIFNKVENEVKNTYNSVNNYSNVQNSLNQAKNSLNELKNKTNEINSILNNSTNTNTNTNANTNTTNAPTVTDAKTSTRENPLTKGTWGIASKYSATAKEDEEVYVRVTNLVRGEEAKKAVESYVNKTYEPKDGYEWVVVDYDLDFANFTKSTSGADARVQVYIDGSGKTSSVVYNGKTYILTSSYIGSSSYVQTQTATGRVAFQMPIGCKDYVMRFGSDSNKSAYFKGE